MNYRHLKSFIDLHLFYKYILLAALLVILTILNLTAQPQELTISQKADSALVKAIGLYDHTIGRNSFLYTGRVYYDDYGGIRGHQFFMEDYWSQGEIVYDGQHFDSVFLMYDIYNDQLLLEHFNSGGILSPIMLYNPKVSSFSIQDHFFIRIEEDTVTGMRESFYDELYTNDHLGIYALRRKQVSKSNRINDFYEEFIERDRFYLKKGDVYHRIRRKKDILNVLSDHKKELRKYLRSNLFLFRKNPENTLVAVAQYYESLVN